MTEGTTRLLETPERPAAPGQNVYEQPGGLAQATNRLPSQANETSRSLDVNRKSSQSVLVGSLLVLVLLLTTLLILFSVRSAKRQPLSPPAVVRPELPPIPPPQPPPLPPSTGGTQGTSINPAYVYPGAETTMEMTDAAEGDTLQLRTSDTLDKVVNWYTEKLKPTKVIRMKNPNSQVVLETDELSVVINSNGNGTSIILTQDRD